MKLYKSILMVAVALFVTLPSFAQNQPTTLEEQEKQLYDAIQKQIEKYEDNLKLEDWQVFYIDSIMVHDYNAMQEEIRNMAESKVTNVDAYERVQDKWMEQMYKSFQGVLDEEQWAKYLKTGAARDKKSRDKRMAKAIN